MTTTIPLGRCEICQGKGVIQGIFHRMECAGCHGAGLVHKTTGEALEPAVMVVQLLQRLGGVEGVIEQQRQHLERKGLAGAAKDYAGQNNKRHRGGGNWTGD